MRYDGQSGGEKRGVVKPWVDKTTIHRFVFTWTGIITNHWVKGPMKCRNGKSWQFRPNLANMDFLKLQLESGFKNLKIITTRQNFDESGL